MKTRKRKAKQVIRKYLTIYYNLVAVDLKVLDYCEFIIIRCIPVFMFFVGTGEQQIQMFNELKI